MLLDIDIDCAITPDLIIDLRYLRWRGTRLVRPCSQLGVHPFKVVDVLAKLGQNYAIGG